MSEFISGKEALAKVSEGIVQYKCDTDPVHDRWTTITDHFWDQYNLGVFLNENTTWKFRLKPSTVNLNGVEVGQVYSSQWDKYNPNKVTIEFKTEKEARHFSNNALKIFNGV